MNRMMMVGALCVVTLAAGCAPNATEWERPGATQDTAEVDSALCWAAASNINQLVQTGDWWLCGQCAAHPLYAKCMGQKGYTAAGG